MFSDIKSDINSIFVDKGYKDINRGIWFKPGDFKGFEEYKLTKEEMESIDTDLVTFETKIRRFMFGYEYLWARSG